MGGQFELSQFQPQKYQNMHSRAPQPQSLYSSKSSIPKPPNSSSSSSEFSFNKGQYDTNKLSIRDDLTRLTKQDLIQIVLQEVEESKLLRIKLATMQDQCRILGSFRDDSVGEGQFVSVGKYRELAQYMEEYIGNTNEAQNYFTACIQQLKSQTTRLKQQNRALKTQLSSPSPSPSPSQQQKIKQLEQTIRNLEDSMGHYISINNEHTRKYERLKKMYETLEQQLSMALDSYHEERTVGEALLECNRENKENCDRRRDGDGTEKEQAELREKVKILEIQNGELKEAWAAMERALEGKSEKIRKLLEEMQKLSQQKWIYKQKYLEMKSKSYALTQSSSKNSAFDSCMHNDVNVDEYGSVIKA